MRKSLGTKKSVLLLVLLLQLLLPSFSSAQQIDSYEITEEELNQLETKLTEQENLINQQEILLNNLEITLEMNDKILMNVQKSLQIYDAEVKKDKWRIGLTVGAVTFTVAGIGGLVAGMLLFK